MPRRQKQKQTPALICTPVDDEEVHISANDGTTEGEYAAAFEWIAAHPSVDTLVVRGPVPDRLWTHIIQNRTIGTLQVRNFGDADPSWAPPIGDVVRYQPSIYSLILYGPFDKESVLDALDAAAETDSLCHLELDLIDFDEDHAHLLAEVLTTTETLLHLCLSNICMSAATCSTVMEALAENNTVERLDYTHVENADARHVACLTDMLERNTTVTTLDLHCNNITNTIDPNVLKSVATVILEDDACDVDDDDKNDCKEDDCG